MYENVMVTRYLMVLNTLLRKYIRKGCKPPPMAIPISLSCEEG